MPRRNVLKYAASAPVLLSLPTVPLVGAPTAGATSAITGRLVFLDPGHNGANDASINEQVAGVHPAAHPPRLSTAADRACRVLRDRDLETAFDELIVLTAERNFDM